VGGEGRGGGGGGGGGDGAGGGGLALAAPSANTSGGPSPTAAAHVMRDLDGRIDGVLDGGDACAVGLESTVVDVSGLDGGGGITVLRPGAIGAAAIAAVAGMPVAVAPEGGIKAAGPPAHANGGGPVPLPDAAPRAPGMKYRHYAPRAGVVLVDPPTAAAFAAAADGAAAAGRSVGVLAPADVCAALAAGGGRRRPLRLVPVGATADDVAGVARGLYAGLRALDDAAGDGGGGGGGGVDVILVGSVADAEGLGGAVMNRLRKAAAGGGGETARRCPSRCTCFFGLFWRGRRGGESVQSRAGATLADGSSAGWPALRLRGAGRGWRWRRTAACRL